MGIEADRFVYAVPQGTYCILCNLVLEDPVEIIKCGHFVCSHCWDTWLENNKNVTTTTTANIIACPYCNVDINPSKTRKSKITWCLIQNCNVYCTKKPDGCEAIYKLGFEDLHRQTCFYENASKTNSCNTNTKTEQTLKCETCSLTSDSANHSHSCVKELLKTLKKQTTEITNLEYENNRLVFKLSSCEKEFMEERVEAEGLYYEETLKYGKEIRDLRTRLSCLQGGLMRTSGQSEMEELKLDLYRVAGSLGFNIIGGASKDDSISSGIYVSRIVEGGAADRPGKLQLHDCILEVDGVDLRNASHELAVKTFKNSGDPVKMVIQRTLNKHKGCDATTQTFGVVFAVTGEEGENKKQQEHTFMNNKSKWLNPHEIADSVHFSGSDEGADILQNTVESKNQESKSDQYDSAYDTLLTQKSSRSSTRSPSIAEQSDGSYTTLKSDRNADTLGVSLSGKTPPDGGTVCLLPSSDDQATIVEGEAWHDVESVTGVEPEYEFEYEEVTLRKEGGKLGMVLCYGGDDKNVTVYVGDIEEDSVADNNGKIMVGDQIVQINDCHVSSVEDAHKLLQESEVITLVVARAIYEHHTDFYDEAEETDLDMLDCIHEENESIFSDKSSVTYMSSTSSKTPSPKSQKKDVPSKSSLPISPLSAKSEPTPQKQSISSEISRARALTLSPVLQHSKKTEEHFQFPQGQRVRSTSVNDSGSHDEKSCEQQQNSSVDVSSARKRDKEHEKTENKESKKNSLKNFVKNKLSNTERKVRPGSHSDDSCELSKIPRCDSNSSNNSNRSNRSSGKETSMPHDQLKAKLKEQKSLSKMRAYLDSPSIQRHRVNTSMAMNPNHHPMTIMNSPPQYLYPGQMINVPVFTQVNPVGMLQPGVSQYQQVLIQPQRIMGINNQRQLRNSLTGSVTSLRSAMKNSTMNVAREKQTKKVHIDAHPGWNDTERRVWEEFKMIQNMESKANGSTQHVNSQPQQDINSSQAETEWRVRRSKDGKHVYIKKTNNARTKALKDREQQINEERCGMTTDDDAFTVYQGKYWRSDQRKKQLHRHNDRRKKMMEKAAVKASYENKTEKAMAELVQRKMMPGTVFDNFITVEEILSQRNRAGIFHGPIHVTTI